MIDDQTRAFLSHLHRGGHFSYWWVLQTRLADWWPVGEMSDVPADNVDVYVGVHPTASRKAANTRSTNEDIVAVNCLFADFDAKDFDRSKPAALARIRQLRIRPSVIVDSGGGYHCYWLLTEPFLLTTAQARERARRTQADWVRFVGGDQGAKDLARVLRVPGTRNWKPQYGPDFPTVFFVEMNLTQTYDLTELEQLPGNKPVQRLTVSAEPEMVSQFNVSAYAQAALNHELNRLADSRVGTRNSNLNRAAFSLGQLVGAGYLDEEEVKDGLYRTACKIGLNRDENCGEAGIRKTIRSGLENGKKSPRSQLPASPPTEDEVATTPAASVADLIARLEALRPVEGRDERRRVEAAALDMVDTLAELSDVELLQVLSCLRGLGVTERFITELKSVVRKQASRPTGGSEFVADKDRSWPYRARDGQMFHLTESRGKLGEIEITETLIADFEARIETEVVSEDGNVTFCLQGTTKDAREFKPEVSAADFADDRQLLAGLTAAAGPSAAVRVGMQKHLRPAIQLLGSAGVRRVRRYTRTGWLGESIFLIPGLEPEGIEITLPRKLPYQLPRDGDLPKGLLALEHLVKAMPPRRSTVALAALLEAPLARLAGWQDERYALFIAGRTGSLKTTWTQKAMSLYGPRFADDGLLVKWGEGATRNAIMNMATSASDLPFLIDNYKPNTGGGTNDFTNLVHNILEGGEKDRLSRTAVLRETKPVFCWPVFTGEDVPDSDPASLARVLIVPFDWPRGETNAELADASRLSRHLAAVGGSWIEWLGSDAGRRVAAEAAKLCEGTRDEWARRLRTNRKDMVNILRVASNLATNQLTWWVLQQHPQIGAVLQKFSADHAAGLCEVAEQMAGRTAESLEAVRFLLALRELLASGRAVLLPRDRTAEQELEQPDRVLGWDDGDEGGVFILPTVAYKMVEKFLGPGGLGGISSKTLYAQLETLGFYQSKGADRHTVIIRSALGNHRVLHLKSDALFAAGDGPADEVSDVLQ